MSTLAPRDLAGLREVLNRPDPAFCAFMNIPDAGVASILGWSGFDFVVLDAEHGPFSLPAARGCVDALAPTPAKAVIRVAANDPTTVKQGLDLGVDGVLFPMVNDGAEAAAAVRASRYSPEGARGVGAGPAQRYGANLAQYLDEANAKVAVLVMIETAAGVENVEEIAAVDGLDGVLVGPADLSADLGLLGQEEHEKVREALARVAEACVGAGVTVGAGCPPSKVGDLGGLGMNLFACYFDGEGIGASAGEAFAEASARWETRGPR